MSFDPENISYHQGEFRKHSECNVNIMTHALQYGTLVFGGLRGYFDEQSDNLYVFRLSDHIRRLLNSAKIMQMKSPLNEKEIMEIILELARKNKYRCNIYFRPFIYKSAMQISPRLHDLEDDLSIYTLKLDDYLDTTRGLNVMVSSWRRIDDNIIPTRAKAGGGYVNSALAKSEAVQNGLDEAIFLDTRGLVSEGSAENIFMVRDNNLITPHLAASVLEGISRKSIIEIAQNEGINVIERDVARAELYISDELFFSGTGAQVAWITSVDRRIIGNGEIGPITEKLREKYMKIVRGRDKKYRDWLTPVY